MGKNQVYFDSYAGFYEKIRTHFIVENLKVESDEYYINFSYIAEVGELFQDSLRPLEIRKLVKDILR